MRRTADTISIAISKLSDLRELIDFSDASDIQKHGMSKLVNTAMENIQNLPRIIQEER